MFEGMVFVLGAGFTRAFVPKAPLLVDDYGIPALRERFATFSHAKTILDDALAEYAEYSDNHVDLERLMTRLSGMPYDAVDAHRELALLESALRKSLVERLRNAKAAGVDWDKLVAFAHFVLTNEGSIVTFNYDDVLDEALWRAATTFRFVPQPFAQYRWHPDGGYGFYCRSSNTCVDDSGGYMDQTRSLLLKLHGSINWRSRLGEGTPRGPAGILRHQDWCHERDRIQHPAGRIEAHLEPDPFIVPPVLVKAELTAHPVLNVVWKLAQEHLTAARTVVFIGYSLPKTDLASRTLFRETLTNREDLHIQVVNKACDDDDKTRVKKAYWSLFPDLTDGQFEFDGALPWIESQLRRLPATTTS